jgi:hypothetical protein
MKFFPRNANPLIPATNNFGEAIAISNALGFEYFTHAFVLTA